MTSGTGDKTKKQAIRTRIWTNDFHGRYFLPSVSWQCIVNGVTHATGRKAVNIHTRNVGEARRIAEYRAYRHYLDYHCDERGRPIIANRGRRW